MKCEGTMFSLLGKKIRDERKRVKLTQSELSRGIVTRNMLSRIENGNAVPSLTTLMLFAERLNVSLTYLLDDADDGSESQNLRLLSLAENEYRDGNYEGCLSYLSSLSTRSDESDRLTARTEYLLAMEYLNCGSLYKAQIRLVSALKQEPLLSRDMVAEGRLYRALIDGFIFRPQSGQEEAVFIEVLKFASAPTDLSIFTGILSLLRSGNKDAAEKMLGTTVFFAPFYRHLLLALISCEDRDWEQAKKHLIEATGFPMISPIRAYCLTLLERVSVFLEDFENAYAYVNTRRELLDILLQK